VSGKTHAILFLNHSLAKDSEALMLKVLNDEATL
jgi:hypothetical protein